MWHTSLSFDGTEHNAGKRRRTPRCIGTPVVCLLSAVGDGVKGGTLEGPCLQPKVIVTESEHSAGALGAITGTVTTS